MKIRLKIIFILFIFCGIISATSLSSDIQTAFIKSKENQKELQKVLNHYKNDTLKYKAACFLIENMDVHHSYQGQTWNKICLKLDSVFSKETNIWKHKSIYDSVFNSYIIENDLQIVPDIEVITSSYLIKNIDMAFEAWQSPYARHLNFEEFCEYLLPYKVGDSPIEDWRELYSDCFIPPLLKSKNVELGKNTNTEICTALKDAIRLELYYYPFPIPDYGPRLLEKLKVGTCRDYSYMAVYAGRSIGLPVSMDFTPQWAKRSMGHEWNALLDYDKKSLDFAFGSSPKLGEHLNTKTNANWIAPKVYKLTYAKQKESLYMIHGDENIPELFVSPCIKDVSKEYFQGTDIAVDIKANTRNKRFVYLAVFNNHEWIPVSWAEIIGKKAVFQTMNTGAVYLPVYYSDNWIYPAAYPVLVGNSGEQIILQPNLSRSQTLVAKRKYTDAYLMYFHKPKAGGKFQLSNDSLFNNDIIDVYTTTSNEEVRYNTINLSLDKPYKYFRYLAPNDSHGDIAEIELYESGNPEKLIGEIIGKFHTPKGREPSKVFDGNSLSFYYTFDWWDTWVGLKFDSPKEIKKIVYLFRNDDNFIREGELYELFYWDNKWLSLGKQIGSIKTQSLTYNNVPTNALFLLRNLTKGQEERIFTYENEMQIWW